MLPRFLGSMRFSAASVPYTVPRYVTAVTRSTSSGCSNATGETTVTMALLTQTSIDPNSLSTRSAARSTALLSDTSTLIGSARPPSCSTSAAVASSASALRARSATAAPVRANSRAAARPTPADAPVTTTTRLCIRLKRHAFTYVPTPSLLRLPLSASRAVDVARSEARVVRSQLHVDRCKLDGLTRTPERTRTPEVLILLLRGAAADLQRSPDRARCDAVDANAAARELLREGLHVVHRCRFRLGVVVEIGRRIVRLLRCRTDDARARLQVRHGRFDDPERRIDVRLHRRVEVFRAQVENRRSRLLTPGVAHDDIQPAELLQRLRNEALAKGFVPQISRDRHA